MSSAVPRWKKNRSSMAQLSSSSATASRFNVPQIHIQDHWQDSYHRLAEAHRRLQRVNQGLEDKLLKLADRSQSEKDALTEHMTSLTTALTTAANAMHRLKGEKERLQQDLNLAIQLLQCNPSQYNSHRFHLLPSHLRQKVRSRMDAESPLASFVPSSPSSNKSTDMKIIRVPIPTFPPTAMVYSLNKDPDDQPNEAEIQEAEDKVSAAIMAAVLEERQKEQRHCPTCTCPSPGGSDSGAVSGDDNGAFTSRNNIGRGGGGCSTNNNSTILGRGVLKNQQFEASENHTELVDNRGLSDFGSKSVCALEKEPHNSPETAQMHIKEINSENETVLPSDAADVSDIDLTDNKNELECVMISSKNEICKKYVALREISITEHFNSDDLSSIAVHNCICGRPYTFGANFIDVGTQTVPSYIGESGKVHSTCIYCKGEKIKDNKKDKASDQRCKKASLHNVTSMTHADKKFCTVAAKTVNNTYKYAPLLRNNQQKEINKSRFIKLRKDHHSSIESEPLLEENCKSPEYCSDDSHTNINSANKENDKNLQQHFRNGSISVWDSPIHLNTSDSKGNCYNNSADNLKGESFDSGSPSTPNSLTSSLRISSSSPLSASSGVASCTEAEFSSSNVSSPIDSPGRSVLRPTDLFAATTPSRNFIEQSPVDAEKSLLKVHSSIPEQRPKCEALTSEIGMLQKKKCDFSSISSINTISLYKCVPGLEYSISNDCSATSLNIKEENNATSSSNDLIQLEGFSPVKKISNNFTCDNFADCRPAHNIDENSLEISTELLARLTRSLEFSDLVVLDVNSNNLTAGSESGCTLNQYKSTSQLQFQKSTDKNLDGILPHAHLTCGISCDSHDSVSKMDGELPFSKSVPSLIKVHDYYSKQTSLSKDQNGCEKLNSVNKFDIDLLGCGSSGTKSSSKHFGTTENCAQVCRRNLRIGAVVASAPTNSARVTNL